MVIESLELGEDEYEVRFSNKIFVVNLLEK
jgi:hypothetical protein